MAREEEILSPRADPQTMDTNKAQALMDSVIEEYRKMIILQNENQERDLQTFQDTENEQRRTEGTGLYRNNLLTYILKPMNLDLELSRVVDPPKKLDLNIKLDQFELSLQHSQLRAILKLTHQIRNYKKEAMKQEKLRRFRIFRPIEPYEDKFDEKQKIYAQRRQKGSFDAKAWWKFAINSILRSIQFKRGSINAFKAKPDQLRSFETQFKRLLLLLVQQCKSDTQRIQMIENKWTEEERATFYHISTLFEKNTIKQWITDVVKPLELAKYSSGDLDNSEKAKDQRRGYFSWIFSRTQPQNMPSQTAKEQELTFLKEEAKEIQNEDITDQNDQLNVGQEESDSDDDLDEFFDCVDDNPSLQENFNKETTIIESSANNSHNEKTTLKTEQKVDNNDELNKTQNKSEQLLQKMIGKTSLTVRNETSFSMTFLINSFSMTLGKLSASNKIEGIQIFSKGGQHKITSPTLNVFEQYTLQSVLLEWGINLITLNRDTNSLVECLPVIMTHMRDFSTNQQEVPQWQLYLAKNAPLLAQQEIEFDVNLKIGQIVVKYDQDLIIRAQAIARLKVNQEFQSDAIDQLEDLKETTQSRLHAIIYKKVNRYYFFLESPIFILPIKQTFKGKYSPVWILKTGDLTVQSAQNSRNLSSQHDRFRMVKFTSQQQNELNMADIVREIMQKSSEQKGQFRDEDVYESFEIWISKASLHYYQSYRTYQQAIKALRTQRSAKNSNTYDQNVQQKQTLQKFQLLQDFELKIILKLRKDQQMVTFEDSEQDKFLRLPKKSLKVNTSSINIALSHSMYNNLYNLKQIFQISKEKQANYEREINEYNVQIRQQISQDALVEGYLTRKVFLENKQKSNQRCYCILAGRYLYFYSEKDQILYKDFFSLKNVTVTVDDGSFIADLTNQNEKYEGPRFELTMLKSQSQLQQIITSDRNRNGFKNTGDNLLQLEKNGQVSYYDLFTNGDLQQISFESNQDLQKWTKALNQIMNEAILDSDATRGTIKGLRKRVSMRLSRAGHGLSLYSRGRRDTNSLQMDQEYGIEDDIGQNHLAQDQTNNLERQVADGETTLDLEKVKRSETVKFEMDLSMPSFEVDLMKLKMVDSSGFKEDILDKKRKSQQVRIFEPWVKFAMVGLLVYRQERPFDMMQKTQINKISLKDQLMVVNSTLMTQSGQTTVATNQLNSSQRSLANSFKEKLGDNQNFDDPAITMEKLEQTANSERFKGTHRETTISMGNLCLNFMPNTINNMLKLMRATRLQTKPVDDQFLAAEEYNEKEIVDMNSEDVESPYFNNKSRKSSDSSSPKQKESTQNFKSGDEIISKSRPELRQQQKILNSVSINDSSFMGEGADNSSSVFQSKRQYQIDPEQEMVQNATDQVKQRTFETNCAREKQTTSRMILQSKKVVMGLIHPIFQMEVFRVEGKEIQLCYEVFYDHAQASCSLSQTSFYDLTGAPYTISPRIFYRQMKKEAKLSESVQRQVLKNPRQMIQIGKMNFDMKMIYSSKCLHKKVGFGNQAKIRIQTLRLDHIQESHFRFQDYFMEQFLECLVLSDPYQDPKKQFDELMKRQQINVQSLTNITDFKQISDIMGMDCQIQKMQIFLKDRPKSKEFLMFEIPLVKIDHKLGKPQKRIKKRSNLFTQTECYNIQMNKMNFIYGLEAQNDQNLAQNQDLYLPLVKQPFTIDLTFTKVTNSEVIQKIDSQEMDKSSSISLDFEHVQLIWPQSIFTYMMRCNDLNIGYTDQMQAEYFFIKWVKLQDYYKQLANVVNKRFRIYIPALALELQHSDGSFIAEIIFTRFSQEQTNYMDFDKQIQISCQKFYILDKESQNDFTQASNTSTEKQDNVEKLRKTRKKNRQDKTEKESGKNYSNKQSFRKIEAILCPLNSQLHFNQSDSIIYAPENGKDYFLQTSISTSNDKSNQNNLGTQMPNFEMTSSMLPNRDKHNRVNIVGVKIFLRMQLFILLRAYFMNSFPVYEEGSTDTPVGFNADPERDCILSMQMNIKRSLICLLNVPGAKSVVFQGDFQTVMLQDNIKHKKEQYEREVRALNDEMRHQNDSPQNFSPNQRTSQNADVEQSTTLIDQDEITTNYMENEVDEQLLLRNGRLQSTSKSQGSSTNDSSQDQTFDLYQRDLNWIARIYLQKVTIDKFTPAVCHFRHLGKGCQIGTLKKRNLIQPMELIFESQFRLTRYQQFFDDQTTVRSSSFIKNSAPLQTESDLNFNNNFGSKTAQNNKQRGFNEDKNNSTLLGGFEMNGGISVDELANEDESIASSSEEDDNQLIKKQAEQSDDFDEEQFLTPTGQIQIILPKSPQNNKNIEQVRFGGQNSANRKSKEVSRTNYSSRGQSFKNSGGNNSGGVTQSRSYEWGVDQVISVFVGQSKMRISIKDVLLMIQLVQFASESMAKDSLKKLQDIHERLIEKEKLDQLLQEWQQKIIVEQRVSNAISQKEQVKKLTQRDLTQYRSFSQQVGEFTTSQNLENFNKAEERGENIDTKESQRKTIFDGLLEKLYPSKDETMKAQFALLQSSTAAYSKIANGYTQKNYLERSTFLEFVVKDLIGDQKSSIPSEFFSAKASEQDFKQAGDFTINKSPNTTETQEFRNRRSTLKRIHTHNQYQNLLQSRMTLQVLPTSASSQIVDQQLLEQRLTAVPESPEGRTSQMISPDRKRITLSHNSGSPKQNSSDVKPIIFTQIEEADEEPISLYINDSEQKNKNARPVSVTLHGKNDYQNSQFAESFSGLVSNAEQNQLRKSQFFNPRQQNQHDTTFSSQTQNQQQVQVESITDAISEFFYSCSGRDKKSLVIEDAHDFGANNSHTQKYIKDENFRSQMEDDHDLGQMEENKSVDQQEVGILAMAAHENLIDNAQRQTMNRWSSQRQKRVGTSLRATRPLLKMPQISEDAKSIRSNFRSKAPSYVSQKQSNSVKYKHCMANLRKKDSNMLVDTMNVLFINDFDIGVTPVLECEVSSLEVKNDEDLAQKNSVMEIEIPMVIINYFNLERGEWEPLLEQFAVQINMNQTVSQRTLIIEFPKQILLNLTLAWVRHYVYTRKAWDQTRVLLQQLLKSEEKEQDSPEIESKDQTMLKSYSKNLKSSSKSSGKSSKSFSINSESFDAAEHRPSTIMKQADIKNQNSEVCNDQIDDTKDFVDESESSEYDEEELFEENQVDDEMQSTSAFLIMNYTNSPIMVVQGGLQDPLSELEMNTLYQRQGNSADFAQFSAQNSNRFLNLPQQSPVQSPFLAHSNNQFFVNSTDGTSKKVLSVAVGQQGKYSVSFNQMISQQRQKLLNEQQERVQRHKNRFTEGQNFIFENPSPQEEDQEGQKDNREVLRDHNRYTTNQSNHHSRTSSAFDSSNNAATNGMKLQNKVYVGVKLNNMDAIQTIDLNEISDLDPYAFLLSNSFQFELLTNQARVVSRQEDMGVDRNLQQFYSELEDMEHDRQINDEVFNQNNLLNRNSYLTTDQNNNNHGQNPHMMQSQYQQRLIKAKNVIEKMKDDKQGLFYNYLFYGVIIDKMSKMLVVRTPYLFFNKTLLVIEVQIIRHTPGGQNSEVQRFILKQDDKYPLEYKYYDSHSISFRVIETNSDTQGSTLANQDSQFSTKNDLSSKLLTNLQKQQANLFQGQPKRRQFCEMIPIKQLINLQLNGAGIFRSGPESDSLGLCLKRQPGNLLGTTDLVFIPPLTVKNTLPCALKILRAPRQLFKVHIIGDSSSADPQNQDEICDYLIETSEERQFFGFEARGSENTEVDFKVQLDDFQVSNLISLNQKRSEELDINLFDYQENQLDLGMRVQLIEAGYHVTIFAHTCILFDTVGLLNAGLMSLVYENQGLGRQLRKLGGAHRRRVAGWSTVQENRFVLGNRDQALYLGIAEDSVKPLKSQRKETGQHQHNVSSEITASNQLQREAGFSVDQATNVESFTVNQNSRDDFQMIEPKAGTEAQRAFFYSPKLEIDGISKTEDFSIKTESIQFQRHRAMRIRNKNNQFDFVMSTSLQLADSRESIYTKMVTISPKYILVNHMRSLLEVAQTETINNLMCSKKMTPGDKLEWFWPDHTKGRLLIIRKASQSQEQQTISPQRQVSPKSQIELAGSEKDKLSSPQRLLLSSNFDQIGSNSRMKSPMTANGQRSDSLQSNEADKQLQWEWSSGFSLDVNDQMSFSVMISEDEGYTRKAVLPRKQAGQSSKANWKIQYRKIIRVTKKLISGTVFVIFEDENPQYPMYRIINQCTNVNLQFEQAELHEKKIDEIGPLQQMNFGLYEPEGIHKIHMTLIIDRNDFGILSSNQKYEKGAKFSQMEEIDLLGAVEDQFKVIEFDSVNGEPQQVIISLKNDGQTKTIFLHNIFEVEDLDFQGFNEGVQTKNVRSGSIVPSKDGLLTSNGGEEGLNLDLEQQLIKTLQTVVQIDMNQLLISFIGNLQMSKNEILTQETKEICLMSIEGAKLIVDQSPSGKRQDVEMRINHFQIDNQIELNPIFQTIFLPKAYFGARRRQNHNDAAFPFFELRISSHLSPSNDVRFVDEFNCEFADTVFTIEDDFLIHAAWVYSQAAELLEDQDAKVHPMFKKQNFCVLKDEAIEKIHCDVHFSQGNLYNPHGVSSNNSDLSRSQYMPNSPSNFTNQRTKSVEKFEGSSKFGTFRDQRLIKGLETIKEESVKNGNAALSIDSESQLQNSYEYGELEFGNGLKGSQLMSSHRAKLSNVYNRNSNEINFDALQDARKREIFAKRNHNNFVMQPEQTPILSNLIGCVLISEKVCETSQDKAPQSQLRWYQQPIENTKQTLYLKNFFIESINIDFSFVVKSKDNSASEERRNFVGPLRYLKKSGLQVISIDEANFQFSRLRRSKIFISQNDLIEQASQHYNADFIQNVRKLIYRVSILQAFPTIFNSSRRGIRELSDLMQQGYEEEGLIGGSHGFASGTISFTKHVSVGIFSSMQMFSQALSDLLLLVTTDGDYSRARDDRMIIEKPKNFVEGIGFGSNCVWVGCTEGLLGLVKRPYIECKRRGIRGLMLGFYQGAIGLMTKPTSSALDLVAKTSEGFKNTIRHVDVDMDRKRIRDPRPFYGRQMLIKPFNHKDALMINTVLHNVEQGIFKDDHFIEVRSVRVKSRETLALLLTEEHLFLIEMTQKELIWQFQTNLIAQVDKLRTGLIIGLAQEYEGQDQFVLPLDDRSSYEIQRWIENIAKQFN